MTWRRSHRLPLAVAVGSFIVAAACGKQPAPAPEAATTPAAAVAPAPLPALDPAEGAPAPAPPEDLTTSLDRTAVPWTGDLDGMIERRVIRVLTTPSKINYFADLATQRGLVYDAFRVFGDDLNAKLESKHIRVEIVIVPVAHDDLIPALLAGRGDVVAAGTLLTEWRREQVDFSIPTRKNISSVVVTGPGVPLVNTPDDLSGREVYGRMSDFSQKGIDQFNAALAARGKAPVKVRAAPEELADEDILEMVNAGLAPMTVVDDYLATFWKSVFPRLVVNRGAAVRTGMETGMLVRKNSPQLLSELNTFLARYPEDSPTRRVLLQRYLKSTKYVKNATSTAERAKFERVVGLFRKYSDRYKVDPVLMAAQGYQESRLDQDAKSPVGAIGVMQVMPATGKDLKVGDINQIENNVHAGVKYMRFVIEEFYQNEPMDRLNKGLFALASYNAGPGRIRGLRKRAAARGLNPNLWFNNVEIVAAEAIGRETVQYVANIYKYYLAYTMLLEQHEEREKALEATAARK